MSSELDKAIEEATVAQGLEPGAFPHQGSTPAGDCPACNGRDTVLATDCGAQCALCKSAWAGDAYALDIQEVSKRARERWEEQSYVAPTPFAQYVALAEWSETPEGKKTLKAITKILRSIFSPSGDEWKED